MVCSDWLQLLVSIEAAVTLVYSAYRAMYGLNMLTRMFCLDAHPLSLTNCMFDLMSDPYLLRHVPVYLAWMRVTSSME